MSHKYVLLKEVCEKASSNIAQKDLAECDGIYPIYGASGYIKSVDFFQQAKDYIAIVKDGAGIGRAMKLPAKSSVIGTMQYVLPNDNINISYLYYAICSMHLEKYFSGATIPHIYFRDYQNEQLPLPTLEEQAKIANVFGRIDYFIKKEKEQLINLDKLVKSRFIEMFGDPLKNERHWEIDTLENLVTDDCSISYGIVQTGEPQENGIPVFRPVDIVGHNPTIEELKKTTVSISNKYRRTILTGRDLLITVRANIADTFIANKEFKGCNVGRGIVPLRVNENVIKLEFLKAMIDFDSINQYIKSKAKGITLIQLNMVDLRLIPFILPPVELQIEFIKFLQQVDKSKFVVTAKFQ